MGEYKSGFSTRYAHIDPKSKAYIMPSTQPRQQQTTLPSNLTATLQDAPSAGNPKLATCPPATLYRLQHLHPAEIITLFTPVVPHPPSTSLAKNMDPFEPLGRALAIQHQVRHVPYRLDHGMTETHADFLHASGAVVMVVCATDHVVAHNRSAFYQQAAFARDAMLAIKNKPSLIGVPVFVLLVSDGPARMAQESCLQHVGPALVTLDEYTPAALSNVVRAMFRSRNPF